MVSFMRTETQQEDFVYNKRPWPCAGLSGLWLLSASLKADLAPPGLTHLAVILFSDSETQPPIAPFFPMSEWPPSLFVLVTFLLHYFLSNLSCHILMMFSCHQ